LRGVTSEKVEPKSTLMQPKKCLRCGELNVFDALHCKKCGMVLDGEKAREIVERQVFLDSFADMLVKNPEFLKKFERFMQESSQE